MPQNLNKFSSTNALGIIALFVGVVEIAFAYPLTTLTGGIQLVIIIFMVLFPVLVLGAFFYVLIRVPENFYSPSDFDNSEVFAQLVTRRDKQMESHLNARTKELHELTNELRSSLNVQTNSLRSISDIIKSLPELDRDALSIEYQQISELFSKTNEMLNNAFERAYKTSHERVSLGISTIKLDLKSFGGEWDFYYLVLIVQDVISDIINKGIKSSGGTGKVTLMDGDLDWTFGYKLYHTENGYGSWLIIWNEGSVCTVA